MALQVRRGTNAERLGITPAEGELIFTTDTKQLYVGDGSTAGGITSIAGTIDSLLADTTPQLGGTLDLNNNDITGTGNINITGTITASGTVNLGDGVGSDILVIGGAIQGHLVPDADVAWNLGSASKHFKEGWISQLNVENQLTATRIMGDIIADDSTVVFDSSTGLIPAAQVSGTFTGNVVGNATGAHTGTFDGDVTGSVFADDSTVLVDAVAGKLVGAYENGVSDISNTAITSATLNAVGSNTNGTVIIQNNSSSALGDQDNLGRILYRENTNTPYWTVGVTKDYYTMFPNPTGTADYTKFAQVWKNGKFQIGGEPGGSGFVGWEREPEATLEVYGNIKISDAKELLLGSMTTTQRDALTAANGMIIYNTTDNKFQGYENGAWANLI